MNGKSNVHLVFKVGKGEIRIGHDGQVDMSKVSDIKSEQLIVIGEFAGEFKKWLAEKGKTIMDKYNIKPAEEERSAPVPKSPRPDAPRQTPRCSAKEAIVYEIFENKPHMVSVKSIAERHGFSLTGVVYYFKELSRKFPLAIRVTHNPRTIGLSLTNDPDNELIRINRDARALINPLPHTEA